MFTCNTLLLSYGGKTLPAGLTALIISTIPLFITLIQSTMPVETIANRWSWIGVITGFFGIGFLLLRSIHEGPVPRKGTLAALGLVTAAFAWALGSVLLSRATFQAPPVVCTCWRMLIGGAVDVLIGLGADGYHNSRWSLEAWLC